MEYLITLVTTCEKGFMNKRILILLGFLLLTSCTKNQYTCECEVDIGNSICNEGKVSIVIEDAYMKINGDSYEYNSQKHPVYSTENKSDTSFFNFYLYPAEPKAVYENEYGKQEYKCSYIGS